MPPERQTPPADDDIVVRSLGLRLPRGQRIATHAHAWHQLVCVTEGVMRIETPAGSWVVPAERAAWIPGGFDHALQMTGRVGLRTVYLRPGPAAALPSACAVIRVSPLLRELVVETLRRGLLLASVPEDARLAAVLADQMRRSDEVPLQLRMPSDPRARAVAQRARADLSRLVPTRELVRDCGASARTIERLFVQQTGLTLGRWLQRARVLHAVERLAAGDSVTQAGLAVGYDGTSAFIALFRRVLGTTPGSWGRRPSAEPD